jgi:hypothetical protein
MPDQAIPPPRSAGGTQARLCVVVLVDSVVVPEWVAWTVSRILAMERFQLAAVVQGSSQAGAPHRSVPFAYRLYERIDGRVFGAPTALRPTPLPPLPGWPGPHPPDVVISFPGTDGPSWKGPTPRHGVWTVAPSADGRPGAALGMLGGDRRRSAGATVVVAQVDGARRVIASAPVVMDRLSVQRTLDAAAWASARLVLRSLERLDCGDTPPRHDDGRLEQPRVPSSHAVLAHAIRTAGRGLAAKGRAAWGHEEWFVAVRTRSANGHVRGPLRRIENPPGRYLADPFPIDVDGRHYLFVEDYSVADGRAVISVLEPTADGRWSPPRTVLRRDHHLSYPFVFRREDETYMIPETGEAGRVELYRAAELPHRWELDRVLLDDLTAVDATLHEHGGLLWLFVNVVDGPYDRGELHLYWSRSLEGAWCAHPANPIVSDPGAARPAGRLFRCRGALTRPSQDCSRRYGEAIVLNRVEVLSPTEYRERPVGRIEADWRPGLVGTHTYTFDSRYECLDAICLVPRLTRRRR